MINGKKPKVLHIITRLIIGGAQENTVSTVEGLGRSSKYEVTLVSGPPLGPEGSLVEEAKKRGIEPIIIPTLRREINPVYDLIALRKLFKLIKKGNYAIVHTHSSKAGILGRIAARMAGVPIIIHTIHGLPFDRYQNLILNRLYIWLERFTGRFTNKLIVVCDAMREGALKERVAPREKFVTIYSGIELKKFRFKEEQFPAEKVKKEFGIPSGVPVVGAVARLFPFKGHNFLLGVIPLILKECPRTHFLFVGEGILKERLIEQAGKKGILDNITFAGLVSPERIPEMIAAMDFAVHTSLREGLARVIPQAFLLEKPVVSFDIGGAGELVINGKTGYLVQPGDSVNLAKRIVELLKNPVKVKRMGEEARKLADPVFSAGLMVKKIEQLYAELLKEKYRSTK